MASLPTNEDLRIARYLAVHLRDDSPGGLPPQDSAGTRAHLPPDIAWEEAFVIERGKDHRVVVVPDTLIARLPRDPGTHDLPTLKRITLLADQLAARTGSLGITWRVPVTLSEPDPRGVLQPYFQGRAHPNHTGDAQALRRVVSNLAEISPDGLALNVPFAQRGGPQDDKLQRLARADRDYALDGLARVGAAFAACVDEWTFDPGQPRGLVHADLAGHNMLWLPPDHPDNPSQRWTLNAILDWDQACLWDPALNATTLSLWHGAHLLPHITTDGDELRRARIWSGWFALESLQDAVGADRPAASVRRLIRKIRPRIDDARQAL